MPALTTRTSRRLPVRWLILPVLAVTVPLFAGESATLRPAPSERDKSVYNLLNPTPRDLMREMSTDRPDATESPITVDAGHFQIETSFVDYGREKRDGVKEEVLTYGSFNLKVGLLNNVDLQLVFDAHTEVKTKDLATNLTETVEGFNDLQVRLKWNLWGNDGGRTAFALFPFVRIPTGSDLSNDRVEGGLILPFSVELNKRFSLGLMLATDFVHDDETDDYETEFVHTAVLGISITDALGAYLEYVGIDGSRDFDYQAIFSGGLTYGLTDNVQFDAGLRAGLNEAAEDFGVFTGLSVRF